MAVIKEPSYRKRSIYHAVLLGSMALLAGAVLVIGDISTSKDIELRNKEDVIATLQQVMPESLHDNDLFDDFIIIDSNEDIFKDHHAKIYQARKNKRIIGVIFQVTGTGYAGDINIMMAVDRNSELLGVRVVSHAETPGLGDKIEVKRNNWITRFTGLSLSSPSEKEWKVKKDGGVFDQFSGATITPRAVVKAIKRGLLFFEANKQQLLIDTQSNIILPAQPPDKGNIQ